MGQLTNGDLLQLKEDELAHYGVLGMKWGVRRSRTGHIKARATLDRKGRKEMAIMADPKSQGYRKAYDAIYKKSAGKIRQGTRKLNRDPRFKGQDFRKPSALRTTYYNEYSKMVTDQLNSATAIKGVKGSKRMTMDWTFDVNKQNLPKATIRMKDTRQGQKEARKTAKEMRRSVRHADDVMTVEELEGAINIEFELDEMGHILDFHIAEDEQVEHSMALGSEFIGQLFGSSDDLPDDALAHYGVLGMKWGVRKDTRGGGRPQGGPSNKKAPRSSVNASNQQQSNRSNQQQSNTSNQQQSNTSNQQQSNTSNQSSKLTKPNSIMSDDELREAINRLQMEKTYTQLMAERNPQRGAKIKKILTDVAVQGSTNILNNAYKTTGTFVIASAIAKHNPTLANAMMSGIVKKEPDDKNKKQNNK